MLNEIGKRTDHNPETAINPDAVIFQLFTIKKWNSVNQDSANELKLIEK
jgi:hypothetical protein